MALTTRCPQCGTAFKVVADQLRVRNGLVRCGVCATVFDGNSQLVAAPSAPVTAPLSVPAAAPMPAAAPPVSVRPAAPAPPPWAVPMEPDAAPASAPHVEPSLAEVPLSVIRGRGDMSRRSGERTDPAFYLPPDDETEDSPPGEDDTFDWRDDGSHGAARFTEYETPAPGRFMAYFWGLLSLLGLLLLAAQAVYVYRNDLATRFPVLRPALESTCATLHCVVSYERHIDRISILSSSLRPPSGAAAVEGHSKFVFRAMLRNRYDAAQPYPALVLELTDFSDTVVARKILSPDLYLAPAQRGKPFEAGADLSIEVPIDVAGLSVNGYQLDKFFP